MAKVTKTEVLKMKTMTKKAYKESLKSQRSVSGFNTGTRDTDKNGKTRHSHGLTVREQKHRNLRPEANY